jgi:hypothetical protein
MTDFLTDLTPTSELPMPIDEQRVDLPAPTDYADHYKANFSYEPVAGVHGRHHSGVVAKRAKR